MLESLKTFVREYKDRIREDEVIDALRFTIWKTCMCIAEDIDKKRQQKGKDPMDMDKWFIPYIYTFDKLLTLGREGCASSFV